MHLGCKKAKPGLNHFSKSLSTNLHLPIRMHHHPDHHPMLAGELLYPQIPLLTHLPADASSAVMQAQIQGWALGRMQIPVAEFHH